MTGPIKEDPRNDPAAPSPPRFRMAIATALALSFGLLVFVAAASVLGIGLWSARENTISLLRDRSELTVDLLEQKLRDHINPMVESTSAIAALIASGNIDPGDMKTLGAHMRSSFAATPQVISAAFISKEMQATLLSRIGDGFQLTKEDWSERKLIQVAFAEARSRRNPFWGDLVWVDRIKATLLNRRAPVYRNGEFIGAYFSSLALSDLSRYLAKFDTTDNATRSFLLYGDNHVLAHTHMAGGSYSRDRDEPIPSLQTIGDPVLANIWNKKLKRVEIDTGKRTRGHLLDYRDETYAIMYRRLDGLSAVPIYAGRYVKLENSWGVEFSRLWRAGVTGMIVVLFAVGVALWLGRRMAQPMRGFAMAADLIRTLKLDPPPHVKRSRLIELDDAAVAFNSMTTGLKWFETYVPKTLVHQLLSDETTSARLASAERDVTVMFTDIRSFTTLSESLAATEVADLLNEHFGLIASCVEETQGTIDKYIGDSVMAFWGAPTKMSDHVNRACTAALAIRKTINGENRRRIAVGLPAIKMGIGIHTGRAIAGNIGAPSRINYALVGDTVNLAQRIEQLCKPLAETDNDVTILVSSSVAEKVTEPFKLEGLGSQPIRGRNEPIDVSRLK
jgi:adenylate cyclase